MWMAGYAVAHQARRGEGPRPLRQGALPRRRGRQAARARDDRPHRHPAPPRGRCRAEVEKKFGIKRAELMLTASHTHCGPVVRDNLIDMYGLSPEETDKVERVHEEAEGRSRRGHRRGGEEPRTRDT